MLKVENLNLCYGKIQVAYDINFVLKESELLALVGINGAGKSSILRAISGLSPKIISGKVHLYDHDITGISPHKILQKGLSHVPEGRRIFNNLTVHENLIMGGNMPGLTRKMVESKIAEYIDRFPFLKEKLNVQANFLSGGEQQILAIVRSLISSPKFLLIDEAFMGLSQKMKNLVKELIIDMKENTSLALLVVDQSLDFSEDRHVDQVLYLEHGKLVDRSESFLVKNIKS